MAQLKLVYYAQHPALHTVANPVTEFDDALAQLVQDMYETMYHEKGIGLAAPQVGISKSIATIDVSDTHDKPFVIINPQILETTDPKLMEEGCLSVPGTYGEVIRGTYVKVRAQDVTGQFFEMEADGLLAHCLQHEIDHLNGKLYIDYLSPIKKRMSLKKMEKFLRKQS